MLYRLATVGIVAFWLVMMGLLVRVETHPESTDILDVPVSYVVKIMFMHGQQSLLAVRDEGRPIGTVAFHPSTTGSNGRSLDVSGALSMLLPLAAARERFNFHGAIDMDPALQVRDFHLEVTLQEPHYHFEMTGDAARKSLTIEERLGDQRTVSQTFPMDAAALAPALLQNLGLQGNALPIAAGDISPPTVTARETQITLHGEQLEVYQVTIHEGTVPVADFYVTQLGQIVLAKTNFGYTMSVEDAQ